MLVLADDLSGAADCAVACRRAGMTAEVRLETGSGGEEVQALALDLDTRSRPPREARERTLAARSATAGRVLYRKIDSTLRGHVGVEVAATLEIAGPTAFAIVCPAYPSMGRTVRDGAVFVGGDPLHTTETWRHAGGGSSSLLDILTESGVRAASLFLPEVRSGALETRLAALRASGVRAVVCDAESASDLERLVAAGLRLEGAVWVGSGGLAIPLSRALSPSAPSASPSLAHRPGPTLIVVGSASSVSRDQLAAVARTPGVRLVRLPPAALLSGEDDGTSSSIAAAAADADVRAVALALEPEFAGPGPLITSALGRLAAPLLPHFGAAVLTGGETARAVLSAAGVEALRIQREVEPGVVLSTAGDLAVVTKAGAFGHTDSLSRALEALRLA